MPIDGHDYCGEKIHIVREKWKREEQRREEEKKRREQEAIPLPASWPVVRSPKPADVPQS